MSLSAEVRQQIEFRNPANEVRRNVVGECEIVTETVKKCRSTKNVKTETVIRRTEKAVLLGCGHKIPYSSFQKVPTKNTRCYDCQRELTD